MKHRLQLSLLLCALVASLVACAAEAERTEPVATKAGGTPSTAPPAAEVKKRDRALLRVINALPGMGAADLKDDQGQVITVVNYKQVTPYAELKSEIQNLRLLPAGQANAQPLATNNEILMAGGHYTAIALPSRDGKAVLRVVNDNLTPPLAGKAKVRVIYAAADAGEVDVFMQGKTQALFDGVNFQAVTNYTDIDATTTTLEVRPEGQQKVLLTVPNAKFEALKIYTVIITGKAQGTPKLEALVIQDELVGAPPSTPSPTPSLIR